MPSCEMCGRPATLRASVEGVEMLVCQACGAYGKVLKTAIHPKYPETKKPEQTPRNKAPTLGITPDYAKRIRDARTRSGLTQKEFALKINQKESVLHHWENGMNEPSIDDARKLEKALKITLVEEQQEAEALPKSQKTGSLTIGDILAKKQ